MRPLWYATYPDVGIVGVIRLVQLCASQRIVRIGIMFDIDQIGVVGMDVDACNVLEAAISMSIGGTDR